MWEGEREGCGVNFWRDSRKESGWVSVFTPGSAHSACIMAISSGEPLKPTIRTGKNVNEKSGFASKPERRCSWGKRGGQGGFTPRNDASCANIHLLPALPCWINTPPSAPPIFPLPLSLRRRVARVEVCGGPQAGGGMSHAAGLSMGISSPSPTVVPGETFFSESCPRSIRATASSAVIAPPATNFSKTSRRLCQFFPNQRRRVC